MRHRVAGHKLDRPTDQRMAVFRQQVADLMRHERLRTTETKAKEVRSLAERMITLGKAGSLHARRQALAFLNDEAVVRKIFDEVAPRYAGRPGGYTRIVKLGPRPGDGAAMVQLELVEAAATKK